MSIDGKSEPSPEAVATAASETLDRTVASVEPFEQGMNAVYRVGFADGADAVLKAGTFTEGPALLSGPVLLERVARETDVPVPDVLATVPAAESSIDLAFAMLEYVDGRLITHVTEFSPASQDRLVREAGRHLAAIHELPFDGQFGRLHAVDGELVVDYGFDAWSGAFPAAFGYALERIHPRFEDLEPALRDAIDRFPAVESERPVDQSILYRDYHPKNLVFATDDDAEPLVRAVLDFNFRPVGDAPLDLAIAELNLVDLPIEEAERRERLRELLRESYVETRGGTQADYFDARCPYYRLLAALDYASHFDYFASFSFDGDAPAAEAWLRGFLRERLEELDAGE